MNSVFQKFFIVFMLGNSQIYFFILDTRWQDLLNSATSYQSSSFQTTGNNKETATQDKIQSKPPTYLLNDKNYSEIIRLLDLNRQAQNEFLIRSKIEWDKDLTALMKLASSEEASKMKDSPDPIIKFLGEKAKIALNTDKALKIAENVLKLHLAYQTNDSEGRDQSLKAIAVSLMGLPGSPASKEIRAAVVLGDTAINTVARELEAAHLMREEVVLRDAERKAREKSQVKLDEYIQSRAQEEANQELARVRALMEVERAKMQVTYPVLAAFKDGKAVVQDWTVNYSTNRPNVVSIANTREEEIVIPEKEISKLAKDSRINPEFIDSLLRQYSLLKQGRVTEAAMANRNSDGSYIRVLKVEKQEPSPSKSVVLKDERAQVLTSGTMSNAESCIWIKIIDASIARFEKSLAGCQTFSAQDSRRQSCTDSTNQIIESEKKRRAETIQMHLKGEGEHYGYTCLGSLGIAG